MIHIRSTGYLHHANTTWTVTRLSLIQEASTWGAAKVSANWLRNGLESRQPARLSETEAI